MLQVSRVRALFGALRSARKRALEGATSLAKSRVLLADREAQLREAHDELERRVALRTAELAKANAGLRREAIERERVEEQLRHVQKMEAVGRLAGAVAHDFNNVLSVILTLVEVNLEELEAGTEVRADFEEIRKAGERAAELTRQLLTFGRRQVAQGKVGSMYDAIADLDPTLRRLVGESITLTLPVAWPRGNVRVDPGSLGQVVTNLVANARDAMPGGGDVRIEAADVVLDETYAREHIDAKAGPHVMLAVTDTGHGMSKATQARIFEPFFTTKTAGNGTGLGLSTVFGIVQRAGGSIAVSSEEGAGTTFRIYLPRVDAPPESDGPRIAPPSERGVANFAIIQRPFDPRVHAREVREVLDAGREP